MVTDWFSSLSQQETFEELHSVASRLTSSTFFLCDSVLLDDEKLSLNFLNCCFLELNMVISSWYWDRLLLFDALFFAWDWLWLDIVYFCERYLNTFFEQQPKFLSLYSQRPRGKKVPNFRASVMYRDDFWRRETNRRQSKGARSIKLLILYYWKSTFYLYN